MIVTGDFHYSDIKENDPELFASAIRRNLEGGVQGAFWRETPVVYTWDDHDFGPNNSDRSSPSREASLQVYRDWVPHYPFALESEGSGIAQSFTWGRVRFVVTDLRSERTRFQSMMSEEQMAWLKNELARAGQEEQLVFWISSVPWNGLVSHDDMWSGFAEQRREIANWIAENRLGGRIAILAGDAHMCAIDDGSNSDFSATGGAPVPVFHAGALDRGPSYKGGPYSHGARPGGQQFGWVEVEDHGGEILLRWSARKSALESGVLQATRDGDGLIQWEFRVPAR
jgi:hypothetical protein